MYVEYRWLSFTQYFQTNNLLDFIYHIKGTSNQFYKYKYDTISLSIAWTPNIEMFAKRENDLFRRY